MGMIRIHCPEGGARIGLKKSEKSSILILFVGRNGLWLGIPMDERLVCEA